MKGRNALLLAAVVLVLAAAGLYHQAPGSEFIWDDVQLFDKWLPYLVDVRGAFFPSEDVPEFGLHYFRPIVNLSYMLDESIVEAFWSDDRRDEGRRYVYHASGVIYFALDTLLVFLLALQLGRTFPAGAPLGAVGAVAAGLLFAAHPVHVESVVWIVARTDVLCGVFFLASLILYLEYLQTARTIALSLSLVLVGGALFVKESGCALLVLLPLADLLVRSRPAGMEARGASRGTEERDQGTVSSRAVAARAMLTRWTILALLALGYFLARAHAMRTRGSLGVALSGFDPRDLFGAVGWYLGKSIWPFPLSAFVPSIPGGFAVVAGILAPLLWLLWCCATVFGRKWPGARRELYAGAIFFASLAPALTVALFKISEAPVAERYLFLPSVGICLLGAFVLERMGDRIPSPARFRRAAPIIAALVLALFGGRAVLQRSAVWRNNLAFWTDTSLRAPAEALPHLNLGIEYDRIGRAGDAMREFKRAADAYKDREGQAKAFNGLGALYVKMGRCDEAIVNFQAALARFPRYPEAHYNWSMCEMLRIPRARSAADRARAISEGFAHVQEALRLNPRYGKARLAYGRLLGVTGRIAEAEAVLRQVMRLHPGSDEAVAAKQILAYQGKR